LTGGSREKERASRLHQGQFDPRGALQFALRLADRQSVKIPSEDPDYGDLGPSFPAWSGPPRGAILQPPKPEMTPSPQILQRAMDRDADWEAAD